MNLYDILKKLEIPYCEVEHQAIYTKEDAIKQDILNKIDGIACINLFVKSKNKYYLIVQKAGKKADLKKLATLVQDTRLTFVPPEKLYQILKQKPGSITPFSIIYDSSNQVTLLIDQDLKNEKILVHPETNTKTLSISMNDLIKVIKYANHKYLYFTSSPN